MATLKENMDAIKLEKDTKILPENLRSGITAFGITGTYEGSGTGTETEGAKIFSTIEEMNASTGNEEGDYAVVLSEAFAGINSTMLFSTMKFPDTVVLDTPISSSSGSCYLMDESNSSASRHLISLSASTFYLRMPTSGYVVRYTSSDGKTYTRVASTNTEYTYEVPLRFRGTWNDAYSKFITVPVTDFLGMYDYRQVSIPNTLFCSNGNNKDNPRCFLFDYKNTTIPSELEDTSSNANGTYHYRHYYIYESTLLYRTNTGIDVYKPTKYKVLFHNYTNTASQASFLFYDYKYGDTYMVGGHRSAAGTSSKPNHGIAILTYENETETMQKYTESQTNSLLGTTIISSSVNEYLFDTIPLDGDTYIFRTSGYGKSASVYTTSGYSGHQVAVISSLPTSTISSYDELVQSDTDAKKLEYVSSTFNNLNAVEHSVTKGNTAYSSNGILVGTNTGGEVKLFDDVIAMNEDIAHEGDKALVWSGSGALSGLYEAEAVGDNLWMKYRKYKGVDTSTKTFVCDEGYVNLTKVLNCMKYMATYHNMSQTTYFGGTIVFEGIDDDGYPINPVIYSYRYASNPSSTDVAICGAASSDISYRPDGKLDMTNPFNQSQGGTPYYVITLDQDAGTGSFTSKTSSSIRASDVYGAYYYKFTDLTDAQIYFSGITYRPNGTIEDTTIREVYDTGNNSTSSSNQYKFTSAKGCVYRLIEGTDASGGAEQVEELQAQVEELQTQLEQIETDTTTQTTVVETQTTALNELATLANEKLV